MGNAANGFFKSIYTTLRGRKILGGSFVTATASVPTSQKGDGVAAYSATGVYTVTLPKKYGVCESLVCTISNEADGDLIVVRSSYAPSTGVLTIGVRDISGAAYANSTGLIVNWVAIFSDRVP